MTSPFYRLLQRSVRCSFRSRRSLCAWARLLGLCYLALSVFLPFQHNHSVGEEETGSDGLTLAQAIPQHNMAARATNALVAMRAASTEGSAHLPAFVKAAKTRSAHCNACDWQAMQVSVALPTFTLFLNETTPPRVVTTLPRYLRSRAIATSSRGPPTV